MKVDQDTFLELYRPVHESFARFCHAKAYGVVEAEDLISESITCALERFHTLKSEKAFLSFLFSIASNLVHKKNRRLKFKGELSEAMELNIPAEGISADSRLDVQLLYKALAKLPKEQEEAIILFEISGFSIKEVAKIQSSGESAVKQRLRRGRKHLAKLLGADDLQKESVTQPSSFLTLVFLSF
ncbi:MAG: RNA polymerase sigma factor [Vicingaceae bacterium]